MKHSSPTQTDARGAQYSTRARRRKRATSPKSRRGASVVEFAIVAPVLFLLVFGIIEFGRLMMVQQAMNNAAREACREASLATTINSEDVDAVARKFMQGVMANATDVQKVRVTLTPASMTGIASGTPVNVDIEAGFADITWLPVDLLSVTGSRVMSAEATFDRE